MVGYWAKTYTIHLRTGAMNISVREVTAGDFSAGCSCFNGDRPALPATTERSSGWQPCDGFAVPGNAKAMADYINTHQISGVTAPNDTTTVFKLIQPASDFLNILALPFASAAPVEYLRYVPDDATFRQHTLSDGPYEITQYNANKEIDLDRTRLGNRPGTDQAPVRGLNQIVQGQSDPGTVQQQIQAGTAMEWTQSCRPPTSRHCGPATTAAASSALTPTRSDLQLQSPEQLRR
jgi:peptide/nickel transport system substrate-binding protein